MSVENTQATAELEELQVGETCRKNCCHCFEHKCIYSFSQSNLYESIALVASVEHSFFSALFQLNSHTNTYIRAKCINTLGLPAHSHTMCHNGPHLSAPFALSAHHLYFCINRSYGSLGCIQSFFFLKKIHHAHCLAWV